VREAGNRDQGKGNRKDKSKTKSEAIANAGSEGLGRKDPGTRERGNKKNRKPG